jgi:NAD(P)-binding Rossmann-like domain
MESTGKDNGVSSLTTSPYYHEYQPDFEKEYASTQAYLEGKSHMKAPRAICIIAIGAGASSLAFAREVCEGRIENAGLVIYEKNNGIGGTWWENRYAGCACDIPSVSLSSRARSCRGNTRCLYLSSTTTSTHGLQTPTGPNSTSTLSQTLHFLTYS